MVHNKFEVQNYFHYRYFYVKKRKISQTNGLIKKILYATKNKWNKTLGHKSVLFLKKFLVQKKLVEKFYVPKYFWSAMGFKMILGQKSFRFKIKWCQQKKYLIPKK